MHRFWSRAFVMRRIDRCYLIATWSKAEERRTRYLKLARYYRDLLVRMTDHRVPQPI